MMDKPLVYFCISMVIGCICALILKINLFLDVAIAASFFTCILFTCDKKYSFIIAAFFIIGFVNFNFYFNIDLDNNCSHTFRIITKGKFYAVAEYRGRNINLIGNLSEAYPGENITAVGQFEKNIDYEKGSIGSFKVKYIINKKEDIISYIYSFRKSIYNKFYWSLGENSTAKVMSVAFGDTSYLSSDDKDEFKKLGIVHVISVSGLHMAIIFRFLENLFKLEIAIAVAIIYAIFTGAQAATVRSLIMIIILKLSKKFTRNYDGFSSLSMAAMILLIIKPYYVVDIGFGLSFLSTLGIILFYKKLSKILYKLPKRLNESISLTISAQSLSMPYVLFSIKNFALGFLIGDLFIIPLYSIIVILSNIALIINFIRPFFNITCFLIGIIMLAINGGTNMLINILPPIIYLSSINIILILFLYPCYIFVKCGYEKFKFVPIVLFISITIYQYNLFPKIDNVYLKKGSGFIVRYRGNNILISNYKIQEKEEINKLQGIFNVNNFITNDKYDYKIIIDNKYLIYIPKSDGLNNTIKVSNIKDKTCLIDFHGEIIKYKTIEWNKNYDIMKINLIKNNINVPKNNINFHIFNDKVIVYKD